MELYQIGMVEVDFDAKKLEESSIRGKANPASIQTGIQLRDKHLQGREYFYIQKFPMIGLQSKSFRSNGKNAFVGIFELADPGCHQGSGNPFYFDTRLGNRKFLKESL
jgi:hypothetical protein